MHHISNELKYLSILIGIIAYLILNTSLQHLFKWYCAPYKSSINPKHLIVVTTGYMGHYVRTKAIQDSFKKYIETTKEDVMVYIAKDYSNGFFFYTYYMNNDGIEKGGQRLFNEIQHIIKSHKSIDKISFIGCSLGGLYNRYCLKLFKVQDDNLLCNGIDDRILKGMNFISLASPHQGVEDLLKQRPFCCSKSFSVHDAAKCIKKIRLLTPTLQQLLLLDKENLIIEMATDDQYLSPLKQFKNRLCFGNAKYDKLVSCSSALMLPEQTKSGLQFWDKMLSKNNKFCIEELDVTRNKIDDDDEDCWFNELRTMIKWKKIIVGWNQNSWTRNLSHNLLAVPSLRYSGGKNVLNMIHKHFIY